MIRCGWNKRAPVAPDFSGTNDAHLHIYPQPAEDRLQLRMEGEVLLNCAITGMDGRVLLQKAFDSKPTYEVLDVSELPAGVYFLQVQGETHQWQEKIVLQ